MLTRQDCVENRDKVYYMTKIKVDLPGNFKEKAETITDPTEIANKFNDHFIIWPFKRISKNDESYTTYT